MAVSLLKNDEYDFLSLIIFSAAFPLDIYEFISKSIILK